MARMVRVVRMKMASAARASGRNSIQCVCMGMVLLKQWRRPAGLR
jgi:hypothetical protein